MVNYVPRVADRELETRLAVMGAVLTEGPEVVREDRYGLPARRHHHPAR